MIYSFTCPAGEQLGVTLTGAIRCQNPDTLVYSASPIVSPVIMEVPAPGLPTDFDYSILGAVFAFAVSVVVAMYVLGRGAGVVLSIFRR